MVSSKSSIAYSLSPCVLLLLHLLLGCCQPSSSATLRGRMDNRWRSPCAGSMTVADDVEEEEEEDTATMSTGESIDAFARLSHRATVLKQIVNSLKNDYVLRRFNNALQAEELIQAGYVVAGSPSWTVSNGNMHETLLTCYENLARLAVLTRIVREGEQSAEANERHHFATAFREIEDNHDAGLYVIMCSLHNVMTDWRIETMSAETEAEVFSIGGAEAPRNNANRHVRDYLVLLALESSADKLSSSFDRLVGQIDSQTTTSATQSTPSTTQ